MLSRIFWIGLAGLALVGGIIMQGGGGILSWGDAADHKRSMAERIEARVDRTIDRSFDKMHVVGDDGQEIEVPPETKRALAAAVSELVRAETDLALLKVRDSSKGEVDAANVRRDKARADVETLKGRIERQKELAGDHRDVIRAHIRDEVRETVRDVVRN